MQQSSKAWHWISIFWGTGQTNRWWLATHLESDRFWQGYCIIRLNIPRTVLSVFAQVGCRLKAVAYCSAVPSVIPEQVFPVTASTIFSTHSNKLTPVTPAPMTAPDWGSLWFSGWWN